jgi:gliding motility-associatede transport system auxiliary component
VRRSGSLFGLLGLLFLVFGFIGAVIIEHPFSDPYVVINLIVGVGLLLAYVSFGFEEFRSLLGQRSTRYGAGSLVYTLLFVAFVAGADWLSWRHHHRWDVTEAGVYTLAPQSKKVVGALTQDLEMTAFVEAGQDAQLQALLESYQYAAPAHVKFRLVDPDKEPALVEQMKVTALRSVHLQYGKESFIVTNPSEESVTNGVIRVSGTSRKTVYFAEGDGEADIANQEDPKGYASAKLSLEQENYEVKPLLLPSVEQVPDDASVVVVAGVQRPLAEHEVQVLDGYLKRGGHLFALVGPRQGDERLPKLLADWGVKLGNDIVIDREVRLFEGPRLGVQPITKTYGTHPITQNFRDYTVYPQTRTVEPDAAGKKGIQATALVKTSPSSWAETKVDDVFTQGVASLDPEDRKGPLDVAVAVEAKLKELGIQAPSAGEGKQAPDEARLVVFGTPMFADNQQLAQSRLNGDLFLNAVGWLVGQEELVAIRSRSVRASRATMTGAQVVQVFYLSVLILPQLLIATGIAVWWRRKSR